jgi:2-succinyl-5-enolpyruvyl-6-hydroxy-3-cyclohexene-1-carboxylate synthase
MDRVLLTAQTVSIERLADAYGWDYRRVATRGDLDAALTASAHPTIIEVPLPR